MSVGELAITPRISLVAVCCSNALVSWRLRSSNSLDRRTFSLAVALSRCIHSASCWLRSAFVCASLATDVFSTGRRSLGFLFLEPFLFVLAIKQKDRNGNIGRGRN